MPNGDWNFPTRVLVGPRRVVALGDVCVAAGISRPLVVTDTGLAGSTIVGRVVDSLRAGRLDVEVFDAVRPDPGERDVVDGVAAFVAHGSDGVIAVGGGSAIDVGKLVALLGRGRRSIWEFEDGIDPLVTLGHDDVAPTVAIPTTAGTGSEVGRASVVTDATTKRVLFHPLLLPAVVICDPELTVGLPRHLTVGTGMDALSHALEAYCSPVYHPAADGIATAAVGLILTHLPIAADHPDDLHARQQMLTAALMAATAFQKGLGAMHALAHPIGAHAGTHHGTTNAVLMPYVLHANRSAIEGRIDGLAAALGIAGGFDGLVATIDDLRRRLGVPATLRELGVRDDLLPTIALAATRDPSAPTNPVPVTEAYAIAVLDAARTGDVGAAPAPLPEPV